MTDTKSYEDYVLGLYAALFSDIAVSYPSLRKGVNRDYKRLLSCVDSRGVGFIVDTMVAFAKHFDRCLADGRLTASGLPCFGSFEHRGVVPRLFKGLLLHVFHINGDLKSEVDHRMIAYLRQVLNLGKAAKLPCPERKVHESVLEFITTDDGIVEPSEIWNSSDPWSCYVADLEFRDLDVHDLPLDCSREGADARRPSKRSDYDAVQRTADIVTSFLGEFNPAEWRFRHGPGAVSDLKGSVLTKYDFPSWPDRLESIFPYADFAFANYGMWADSLQRGSAERMETSEQSSKLIAVPKTYRGPRLIAAEPTSHQWCQQSILAFLVDRVQKSPISRCIRFSDQSWNGDLALEASRRGSHATIDLSSASDRVSCYVIERLFRRSPSLLCALSASRTRFITQHLDKKLPSVVKLRKFSTMGSAVTFPTQTILFTVIAVSATLIERGLPVTIKNIRSVSGQVRVFGDDIIVPKDAWSKTMELLEAFGLKVNVSKTFGTGLFRESCGTDAYQGTLVPKVNVNHAPSSTKPETIVSSVDCHNNLILQGLWNTANYVKRAVEAAGRYAFPSVCIGSGVTGWLTFEEPSNHHLKSRWNEKFQRREYLVSQPFAAVQRHPYGYDGSLLQYFTECARSSTFIRGERLGVPVNQRALKLRRTWVSIP